VRRLERLEALQEPLKALALATNWANFATSAPDATQALCGSWIDKSGNVHVQGLVRRTGATFVFPIAIGTLPAAHVPAFSHGYGCYGVDSAGAYATYRVIVDHTGTITVIDAHPAANGGIGTIIYLDTIFFRRDT
jgi:hypothetical protein